MLRAKCVTELPVFNGLHRFMPTLLRVKGFSVAELTVNHRPRLRGVSKYGVHNRLWRGIRDCFGVRWFRMRAVPGKRLDG
jgi:dolichol-phosphate mannosyltransferase